MQLGSREAYTAGGDHRGLVGEGAASFPLLKIPIILQCECQLRHFLECQMGIWPVWGKLRQGSRGGPMGTTDLT